MNPVDDDMDCETCGELNRRLALEAERRRKEEKSVARLKPGQKPKAVPQPDAGFDALLDKVDKKCREAVQLWLDGVESILAEHRGYVRPESEEEAHDLFPDVVAKVWLTSEGWELEVVSGGEKVVHGSKAFSGKFDAERLRGKVVEMVVEGMEEFEDRRLREGSRGGQKKGR